MYLNNIYTFCCSPWSSHVWPRQLEPYETNVVSELLRPACSKLEQWAGFYYSDTQYIRLGFTRYVLAIQGRIKLHCGTVMGGGGANFDSLCRATLQFSTSRLCERPGRDGYQSALWDCFWGRIFNMAANSSHKTVPECTLTIILTQSLAQPQSGE